MALWEVETGTDSSLSPGLRRALSPTDLGQGCYFPKLQDVGDHKNPRALGGQKPWEGVHLRYESRGALFRKRKGRSEGARVVDMLLRLFSEKGLPGEQFQHEPFSIGTSSQSVEG